MISVGLRYLLCSIIFMNTTHAGEAQVSDQSLPKDIVHLQLLNKISGKKSDIEIPVGSAFIIDNIRVVPGGCKPAIGLFSDDKAFRTSIEVFIEQEAADLVLLYKGTLYSDPHHPKEPIEHPIYHILLKGCSQKSSDVSSIDQRPEQTKQ